MFPVKQNRYATIVAALLPWAGYTAGTLFLLRNLLPLITDHLPGNTDGWQNMWNLWWMRFALLDLHTNPFFSDYIYYPNGVSLLFHTYAPLNGALALPFTVALGPLITTNLVIISSFVFTGMAAYALARGLGLGAFEAWLAGAVYTFCNPARWHYLGGGQADQLMMQWMPLYILCLVKVTSKEYVGDPAAPPAPPARLPWKWLLGAALFYAFNGLTNWQFFVYMSVFSLLYGIYLMFRGHGRKERLSAIRNLAIIAGGAALILSPLLYTTISEALHPAYSITPPPGETIDHSFDLTTYFTPNKSNPIWGDWAAEQNFPGNQYGSVHGVSNAGYLPMLLAVVGLVFYGRKMYQWAIFGLVFAVLSLGPILHFNGADSFGPNGIEIPMPYQLLQKIPFFNISRDPARFSLTAFLCLGLLAGFGWRALRQRFTFVSAPGRTGYAAMAMAMVLAAIITVGEFSTITYPITTQPIPQFFYTLRQDPQTYALVEVPIIDKDYAEYTEALISIHHKQIMGGQTARKPCYCFPMETPVVRWFWDLSIPGNDDIVTNPDPSTYAAAILRYFNLRYIVIYKWMLAADKYDAAKSVVSAIMPGARPVADDATATIYAVPPISTTAIMPLLLLEGWGQLEKGSNGSQRWVGNDPVRAVVVNASDSPRTVKLEMKVASYNQQHTLQVDLNDTQVAQMPITTQIQTVAVNLTLAPGRNVVRLSSQERGVRPSKLEPHSADTRILTFVVFSLGIK